MPKRKKRSELFPVTSFRAIFAYYAKFKTSKKNISHEAFLDLADWQQSCAKNTAHIDQKIRIKIQMSRSKSFEKCEVE